MRKRIVEKFILGLSVLALAFGLSGGVVKAEGNEELIEINTDYFYEEEWIDNEDRNDLLMGYIEGYNEISTFASDNNGEKLSGLNKLMYDAAISQVKSIAAGTECSSIISLNISGTEYANKYYSAADLNVSQLIDSNNYITSDAMNALFDKCDYDPVLVWYTVQRDCPYEMYWSGLRVGYGGCSGKIENGTVKIGLANTISLKLYVYRDFAVSDFVVDTTKTQAVAGTYSKVMAIVNENDELSDYEKLKAYTAKICELTDYNKSAAEESETDETLYGNPWQLIWIFDGNPETKVVCEGYSKAFQYLCENTIFDSDKIVVNSVSGNLTTPKVSGPHMWNVVHMEDDKNYLIDVTNCDSGDRGGFGPYLFFMLPVNSGDVSTAYCFNVNHFGNCYYTYADNTRKVFSNEELTISTTAYVKPHATHTYNQEVTNSNTLKSPATCTSQAIYYKSCTCGAKGTETFTSGSALNHNWDEGEVTKPATETIKGERTYHCTRTGCTATKKEDIPLLTHTHVYNVCKEESTYLKTAAKCTTPAVYYKSCSCGAKGTETFTSSTPAPGHDYCKEVVSDYYKKSDATCISKAIYYKSCACGAKSAETFEHGDTLPHTYNQENPVSKYLANAATCYSKATYYRSCTCGAKGTTKFEYGDKLPHSWDDGTITKVATEDAEGEITYRCKTSGCDATKTENTQKLQHTHVYNKLVRNSQNLKKAATCQNPATYYKSCACGEHGTATFTYGESLAHNWDEGTITKQPTTKATGVKTYHCKNSGCSQTNTETIPKIDGEAGGDKNQDKKDRTPIEQFVCRIYTDCLGRTPEEDGVKYWAAELSSGKRDGASVGAGFVFSDEYMRKGTTRKEYVKMLYVVFMGREADEAGLNYWLDNMKNGMTREEVFKGFVDSREYTLICTTYGIQRGDYKLQGISDPEIKDGKVTTEITSFVERIYVKALNRKSDPSGIAYWSQEIANETKTPVEVAKLFIFSKEFEDKKLNDTEYIKVLYRTFMGREADKVGLNYWLGELNNGQSRERVLERFAGCDEFQDIIKSFGL